MMEAMDVCARAAASALAAGAGGSGAEGAAGAMEAAGAPGLVHYLPILTTLISGAFLVALLSRASQRAWAPHLVWWAIGVFFYGVGTALESTVTLMGNTPTLNRLWYWAGAILGGYPLGTGSLYLLAPRRLAHTLTAMSLVVVVVASVAVFLSPMDPVGIAAETHRPSGAHLEWQWVRLLTPFINIYAAVWLVGGAFWSSVRFFRHTMSRDRAVGTALIGVGGLLPGIGGSMAKAGIVEALYIGELTGIILIWIGYWMCIKGPAPTRVEPVVDPITEAPAEGDIHHPRGDAGEQQINPNA